MKQSLLLWILGAFMCFAADAQQIEGQWKGYFDSKGDIVTTGSNNTEYVLELEINGTSVGGFSYSYFQGRRYYVICKLEGSYNKSTQSIRVTETERIKGNTPPDFTDCFQIHFLTWEKDGKVEKLVGRWETAPGQLGGCGVGRTTLTRRTLSNDLAGFNKSTPLAKPAVPKSRIPLTAQKTKPTIKPKPTIAQSGKPKPTVKQPVAIAAKPQPRSNPVIPAPTPKTEPVVTSPVLPKPIQEAPKLPAPELAPLKGFEKRNSNLLKTIEIENETFTVDLYDNGEVDGDSVSVFYNGKLILSHKRLSDKALTITLPANSGKEVNELTMYAENLGEIPPNTALMVVKDGDNRYETRISSDLSKSGTIHFIHKPKKTQ